MPSSPHSALVILVSALALCGCVGAASPPVAVLPFQTQTPGPAPTLTPVRSASPTAIAGQIHDVYGTVMNLVPAGVFTMGSDQGFPDELPIHKVSLDAFFIDRLEVTNAQYAACVAARACSPPFRTDCCSLATLVPRPVYFGNPDFADYPVTWLSWTQATIYCRWRGARLPTEAEWEKAARGSDGRTYPWGDETPTPDRLNFTWKPDEFDAKPLFNSSRVGSYPLGASPYGILDMAGNVYEWVSDIYDPGYYAVSPYHNPTGPSAGKYRVARGGSFFNQAFRNRSSNRNYDAFLTADVAEFDAGVRCAKNGSG